MRYPFDLYQHCYHRERRAMLKLQRRYAALLSSIVMVSITAIAAAQGDPWPVKPVRWIVPFPPGGSTDIIARLVSPKLAESFSQQVIVDLAKLRQRGATHLVLTANTVWWLDYYKEFADHVARTATKREATSEFTIYELNPAQP